MLSLPVLPLSSALRGHSTALLHHVLEHFHQCSGITLKPVSAEEAEKEALPVLLHLTGGTEHLALRFAERTKAPLLLLAHASHNSLAAALETLAGLRERGRKAWLLPTGLAADLPLWAQVAEMARQLRGRKIGFLGQPSPWLVASTPDPYALQEKLGLELAFLPLSRLFEANAVAQSLPEGPTREVGAKELRMGAELHSSLRRIVEQEGLFAFSIACFELIPRECTACWAVAKLADEGVPAGCEGDLPGLLALILSQLVAGRPGFLANPVEVDLKKERLLLAHCTVPFSLVETFELRTHFESGLGLAVAGALAPGSYTLLRFGGRKLEKAFIVEGSVLSERPGRDDLCRTQVWFKMPKGAVQRLLREPLGNHHVLVPGHHRRLLALFHEVMLADP